MLRIACLFVWNDHGRAHHYDHDPHVQNKLCKIVGLMIAMLLELRVSLRNDESTRTNMQIKSRLF